MDRQREPGGLTRLSGNGPGRGEQAAERTGSLVADQVRALLDGARGRADEQRDRARREADELARLRAEVVAGVVTRVDELEGSLRSFTAEVRRATTAEAPRELSMGAWGEQAAPEEQAGSEDQAAPEDQAASPEPAPSEVSAPEEAGEPEGPSDRLGGLLRRMRSRSESEDAPRADAPSPPEAPSRAEQMSGVGAEAPVEDREATDYSCSVCGRRFEGTADDLQQAGWSLQDGVVTCADCRAAGWQAS